MAGPETRSGATQLRSLVAVVAALITVAATTTAADQMLHVTGVYPSWGEPMKDTDLNLLALSYRLAFGALGGWVAARLAPHSPIAHALIFGLLGTLLSIAGGIAMAAMSPTWFLVAVTVIALPSAWAGGRLAVG